MLSSDSANVSSMVSPALPSRADRTGCFEAVYAGLFGWSYLALWLAFFKWMKLLWIALHEWINFAPTDSGLEGQALWFDMLIAASILLAIFQVGRTYYYTHLFDEQHRNSFHFITHLTSMPRFWDRLFRLFIAALTVLAVEFYAEGGLVRYHEHRLTTGECDYRLLLPLAKTVLILFSLLFVWDLNLCFWRKVRMPLLPDKDKIASSLTLYDPNLKMVQRLSGIVYSVILCYLLTSGPIGFALFLFGFALAIFGILWILDYVKNAHRIWWRDAARELPDDSGWFICVIKENLSWLLTLSQLLLPNLTIKSKAVKNEPFMKRNSILLIAGALLLATFAFLLSREHKDASTISMAIGKNVWCSLPIIAQEKGYFAQEGLNVQFNYQDAGRYCMDALLSRSVDFAAVVEANIAYVGFTGNRTPVIIGEIVSSSCGIVCRKSTGIVGETDLRGKKIGYTPATGAEPFLYRFLAKNRISISEVELRKMQPKALQPALVAREIDAAATWEPFIYNCTKAMSGDATEFRDPEAFTGYMMLATRREWIEKRRDAVDAMLRALAKAEAYVKGNPADSQAVLAKYLGMDIEAVEKIWPYFKIGLRMDKTDVLQAIGYVAQNARNIDPEFADKKIPNYDTYIDDSFLTRKEQR